MFDPKNFTATPAHKEVFGLYERVYTVIDLVAALAFVVGSILFFWSSTAIPATWLFLIGSLCFAAKPCVRFLRENHLARLPLPEDDPKP